VNLLVSLGLSHAWALVVSGAFRRKETHGTA
jgi:hypothetical protein